MFKFQMDALFLVILGVFIGVAGTMVCGIIMQNLSTAPVVQNHPHAFHVQPVNLPLPPHIGKEAPVIFVTHESVWINFPFR